VLDASSMSHCIVARARGTPRYWHALLGYLLLSHWWERVI
jgi:hypothetical protein